MGLLEYITHPAKKQALLENGRKKTFLLCKSIKTYKTIYI